MGEIRCTQIIIFNGFKQYELHIIIRIHVPKLKLNDQCWQCQVVREDTTYLTLPSFELKTLQTLRSEPYTTVQSKTSMDLLNANFL